MQIKIELGPSLIPCVMFLESAPPGLTEPPAFIGVIQQPVDGSGESARISSEDDVPSIAGVETSLTPEADAALVASFLKELK